ncbi:MAG: hypothetical protein ACK4UN_18415 [Limisphaerales bacterium]
MKECLNTEEMLNLKQLAQQNSDAFEAAYLQCLESARDGQKPRLEQFASWVNTQSVVSINVRPFVLSQLLAGGHYKNVYERAEERARALGHSVNEIL